MVDPIVSRAQERAYTHYYYGHHELEVDLSWAQISAQLEGDLRHARRLDAEARDLRLARRLDAEARELS